MDSDAILKSGSLRLSFVSTRLVQNITRGNAQVILRASLLTWTACISGGEPRTHTLRLDQDTVLRLKRNLHGVIIGNTRTGSLLTLFFHGGKESKTEDALTWFEVLQNHTRIMGATHQRLCRAAKRRPSLQVRDVFFGMPHVLLRILRLLGWLQGHRTLLMDIPSVCRKWRDVCRSDVCANLDFRWSHTEGSVGNRGLKRSLLNDTGFTSLLLRFAGTTCVVLAGCQELSESALSRISHCPDLLTCDLSWCQGVTDHLLDKISTHCRCIRHLRLNDCVGITDKGLSAMSRLSQLSDLALQRCSQVTGEGLRGLHGLKNLVALDLCGCFQIGDAGVSVLGEGQYALSGLNLEGCTVTDRGARHLLQCRHLRYLNMACNLLTEIGLSLLLPSLKSLVELNLECCAIDFCRAPAFSQLSALNVCCSNVRDAGLSRISRTTPHLVTLDLSSCDLSADVFEELTKLTNLTDLNLSNCPCITDCVLSTLACHLLQLRYLGLRRCHKVTDAGIGQLQKLPQLSSLDLTCCNKTTQKGRTVFGARTRVLF